ncbi:hypothetical protein FH603_2680 [Spirosoma sp. LMG 31447]|uniref:Uncharacterized protein n=1 Tax=Spirosoma utsteinense TaxID=2585773 RepID=A0ABR6W6F4_9BACT|nr:hypothetical protein [Spirosoma utsteinense]
MRNVGYGQLGRAILGVNTLFRMLTPIPVDYFSLVKSQFVLQIELTIFNQ